jgi:hypothetical protein
MHLLLKLTCVAFVGIRPIEFQRITVLTDEKLLKLLDRMIALKMAAMKVEKSTAWLSSKEHRIRNKQATGKSAGTETKN